MLLVLWFIGFALVLLSFLLQKKFAIPTILIGCAIILIASLVNFFIHSTT